MNRRDFIKRSAVSLVGILTGWGILEANADYAALYKAAEAEDLASRLLMPNVARRQADFNFLEIMEFLQRAGLGAGKTGVSLEKAKGMLEGYDGDLS